LCDNQIGQVDANQQQPEESGHNHIELDNTEKI